MTNLSEKDIEKRILRLEALQFGEMQFPEDFEYPDGVAETQEHGDEFHTDEYASDPHGDAAHSEEYAKPGHDHAGEQLNPDALGGTLVDRTEPITNLSGDIYVTESGAADPTQHEGDLWFEVDTS